MQITERLRKLNNHLHEFEYKRNKTSFFYNKNILNIEEKKFLLNEPIVIRKAYAIRYIAENLPIEIKDDELIVGLPDINSETLGICIPRYLTDNERKIFQKYYNVNELSIYGHHPAGYEKILQKGIIRLKDEINENLLAECNKKNINEDVVNEYKAMILSLEAIGIYAKRCANKILKIIVSENNNKRKKELIKIYEICNKVPFYPAKTFHEAIQSFWFVYIILNSGGELIPFGRIDQYFYKYYRNDIVRNLISKEEAIDILGSFLIKCNEKIIIDIQNSNLKKYTHDFKREDYVYDKDKDVDCDKNYYFGQAANHTLMTATVGGIKADGSDATNELSYMILELVFKMNLLLPILGARIHENTSEKFLDLLTTILSESQGEPIIYNDKPIINGYVNFGMQIEDAREYSSDGCWETLIPGKTNFYHLDVYLLLCLENVLNKGNSLKQNLPYYLQQGINTGNIEQFVTFDLLYDALIMQMYHQMDFWNNYAKEIYGLNGLAAPNPLFSAITDSCIENGKDFYSGGAKYNIRMLVLAGLADTVDALNAIKTVVYDKKMISLEDLNKALHSNWQGYENLRAYIINKIPKFGNDNEADFMAEKIIEDFSKKLKKIRSNDKILYWTGGIGTFFGYAEIGHKITASANGRYNYEPIAPNYSPVPGFDKNGPTSIIKSITKPNLKELFGGTPVDISLNKNEVYGLAGKLRIKSLIKSFCELGGNIMTLTTASVDELREAQKYPEKHQNLRVRVGGLSAYFVSLSPAQQNTIIERFK